VVCRSQLPPWRDILRAVHPPECKKRFIMALRFYGDESQGQRVIGVAGFLGDGDEWDSLQEKWIARVKPTGAKAYHMTDCDNGWGDFSDKKGWNKDSRTQLTIDLIELICQHNIYLIGEAIVLDDYRELPPVTDAGDQLGRDEWHAAFQGVLHEAAASLGDECPPEETIAFFFDWRQKQGGAQFFFDYTKNEERLKPWHFRLGTLTFGHKEFDIPGSLPLLQVADIAAVETRRRIENPLIAPHLGERKSLTRLKQAGRVWSITYHNKATLTAIYELKREELGLPNKAAEIDKKLLR
jgi:hypothetical protein